MEADPNATNNNPPKPVAYDANGQPLYAAPVEPAVVPSQASHPQIVHMTRALDPVDIQVSPEVQKRHDQSIKLFPNINLSEHEFVIRAVRRHPIGLILPLSVIVLAISIVFSLMFNFPYIAELVGLSEDLFGGILLIGSLFSLLLLVGCYVVIMVYINNRFILTNESVIQEIQNGLFARKEQTVSLGNIEDASYNQKGFVQTMLNYGSIRLSTEGDETTYRFDYVSNPREHIAVLNNAVESFKNGRPIDPNDN